MADSTQNDINFAAVKTVCVYDAFTADLNDDSLISMATFDGPITEDDVMDYAAAAQVLQNEMAVLIEEDGAPHNEKWHHDGTIGSPKEARLHLEKIEATLFLKKDGGKSGTFLCWGYQEIEQRGDKLHVCLGFDT